MSFGSEILRIFINIAIILIVCGMLYEFFNWLIKNVFLPIADLRKELNKIPDLLTIYSKAYSNSENSDRQELSKVSNETKMLATRIIAGRDAIPVYSFFTKLGIVNSREVLDEIVESLSCLAGALVETGDSQSSVNLVQQKITKLEQCLGVAKHSKRHKKVQTTATETEPENHI